MPSPTETRRSTSVGRNKRRRPTGARRATFAAVALMLGGGGLVAVNVYASATEDGWGQEASPVSGTATIDCPDVGAQLTTVPDEAREEVDNELALLDKQIAEAYQRLQDPAEAGNQDSSATDSEIMNPLKEDRAETIERIAAAIDQVGDRPEGLDQLAPCTLRESAEQPGDGSGGDGGAQPGQEQQGGGQDGGQQQGNGGQAGNGPVAADFADITAVQPNVQSPDPQDGASTGTFTTRCGVNANGLFNSDNVIVAPGVSNGAHHFHDYIGNQSNNAFASDDDLANAETTCEDQGDKSTYYWPVLRLQNGTQEQDANSPGGGIEGNAGEIVTAKDVTLTFVGNPRSEVTAMPRLLRIITGDAKAFVNGPANANASWSCTGFEDRQLKDKYPLCPQGSDVVRTFKFQSCWDGRNIDSANHRTHVAFAQADGSCGQGFTAIPQLVQRIVYDVDAPSLQDGGRTTPLFAVDSFPEQLHKPVTDHGDFINVFDEDLMQEMADCINEGRDCGAGQAEEPGGSDEPTENPEEQPTENPDDQPTSAPVTPGDGQDDTAGNGGGNEQATQDPADTPGSGQPDDSANGSGSDSANDPANGSGGDEPRVLATSSPTQRADEPKAENTSEEIGDSYTTSTETPSTGDGTQNVAAPQGGLADTGANLWPAAAGAVLLICGFVLLRRTRRSAR
ncbi:DUF1996 domain-containing protein [Streptomyces sp. HUCO-GS316]|nr:DUF1996 domain-containing protein [Streptomyces sp. HUCO-GS316]